MTFRFKLLAFLIVAVPASLSNASVSQGNANDFRDGCCLTTFPRPKNVSQATVPRRILLEAVNCATSQVGGAEPTADNKEALTVSYYFGLYMPQQETKALTIAVYSADGKTGWLFDVQREGHKYYIANMPELLKARNHWRVGEINGGLWSYTRLWYLAQEIGSRPRQELTVRTVVRAKPAFCKIGYPVWPTRLAR